MKSLEERVQEAFENTLEVTKDRVSIRIDLTDKEKEIFVKCVEKITGKKPKSFVGFRGGKVKELKLYQCEVCRTQYADKEEAKRCEQYHVRGLEIDCCSYRGMNETSEKFPVKIWVKAKSGEERMYRL